MEYNTGRIQLGMKEYGRHVQSMVDYLLGVEDREKRQKQAESIIELMGFLNPQLKTIEDYKHKLWDHLFVISDFKLDVDSPYPIPDRETYKRKPDPLPYPKRYPKYAHLGKNLELVIDKALQQEDPEKKAGFAHAIAYYMKLSYSNWHKELVHDDSIRSELDSITGGGLEFSNTPFIKHRTQIETDDYPARGKNRRQQFGNRQGGNRPNGNWGNGNRQGGNNRPTGNANGNRMEGRDNRQGGNNRPNNNGGGGFKKRY